MRQPVTILFLLVYLLPAVFSGNMLLNIANSRPLTTSCSKDKMQDQPAPAKSSSAGHYPHHHPVKAKPVSPAHFFIAALPAAFDINSSMLAAGEKNIFLAATGFAGNCTAVWQPPRLS